MLRNRSVGKLEVVLVVAIGVLVVSTSAWAQNKYKTLYRFTGGPDGGTPQAGLILDSGGNPYGTTYAGGNLRCAASTNGCGVVFKLVPNGDGTWTESVLYSFAGGNDGALPAASLIFDSAGSLYGTTYDGGINNSGTVFKLTPNRDGSWAESVLYRFCSLTNCADGEYPSGD
jgi:uncharacterized repeat protein (TIGR03803 family)